MKNKITLIITSAMILAVIVACAAPKPETTTQPTTETTTTTTAKTEKPKEDALKISASDLMKAYSDNKVKADDLYKGKMLEVSGTIDSIGKDIMDYPFVALKTGEPIFSVQVYFTDDENKKLGDLKKGQKLTVVGKCDGAMGNVILKDATIKP